MEVIRGKVPSKSNSYQIITKDGHASLCKKPALIAYETAFYLQCARYRNKNIKGLFELRLNVYHENNRPDLDNALKIILDILQSRCKGISNDRNCVRIVAEKFIDKKDPRIEFELIEI